MTKKKLRLVPGYSAYGISDSGELWRLAKSDSPRAKMPHPHRLAGTVGNHGYLTYTLSRSGEKPRQFTAHALVALAFIGPRQEGMHVRHLDGDRRNNCAANLAYGTPLENNRDMDRHGTRVFGERHKSSVLDQRKVRVIRKLHEYKFSGASIAHLVSCSDATVCAVLKGDRWSHVK